MLNKIEGSNKLANAVFHGRNREFKYAGKNEQLVADGCKRLIENAIICWNYIYLSQKIYTAKSDKERKNIIQAIRNGSVVAWWHINLQGEYDFSEDILKDSIEFRLTDLLELQIS